MSRNLDRALETIDELLDQEGQHSDEPSYGHDRPGACWRCLSRDAEGDTELCSPCSAFLRDETDQDPANPERPKAGSFEHLIRERLETRLHQVLIYGESHEERRPLEGIRGIDAHVVTSRHVPPGRIYYTATPLVPSALRSPIRQAAEREQAIANIARAFDLSPELLETVAEGMRRIGVAAQEAMETIRATFEGVGEALADFAERAGELVADVEDERRARDLERSRRAIREHQALARTLGPRDLRATEAPRQPITNHRRRYHP